MGQSVDLDTNKLNRNKLKYIYFTFLLMASCTPLQIKIIDINDRPIEGLKVELLNLEESQKLGTANPRGNGEYRINKNDIPGDSFYVRINSDQYFPIHRKLSILNTVQFTLVLEEKMTGVWGKVYSWTVKDNTTGQWINLDNEAHGKPQPINKSRIKIEELDNVEILTNVNGIFKLKSNKFEEKNYKIRISKKGYKPQTTNFKSYLNKVDTLKMTILLEPIIPIIIKVGNGVITPPQGGDPMTTGTPDGYRDGLQSEKYSNGQKRWEGKYKDDTKVGKWTYWYENGEIQETGKYRNGARKGEWTYYNEDASVIEVKKH